MMTASTAGCLTSRQQPRLYFDDRLPLRLSSSRDISPILDNLASFSFSRRASFWPRLPSCCCLPERLSFCPNCLPAMTASNGVASTQKSTHKAVAGSVGPFTATLTTNGSLYRRLDELRRRIR